MHPWEAIQRVREQDLLIQIEYVTDKEMSETIRDICMREENGYVFNQYLRKLDAVLEAILMGIPIDNILKVINNRIKGKTIYTLMEEYRVKSLNQCLDALADFVKITERIEVGENNRLLREKYKYKKKSGGRITIRTRQQGCALKYKRYELRIYGRMVKCSRKIKYIKEGEYIMLHIDLSQLAGGTLQEKFDREITKVIDNMQDPNTPFSDKRGITINISFSQNEMRDDAKIEISLKTKLAGVLSAKTNFAMGKDLRSGEVMVNEYGKQIPGQMSFSDIDQNTVETKVTPIQPRKLGAN